MKNLTINDLKLGLADMLDPNKPRFSLLLTTKAWNFYGDNLLKKHKELLALPADAFVVTRQNTIELTATDELHDGFGGAIFFLIESYRRAPDTSLGLKQIAQELRDNFINKLSELKDSYADESARARERLQKLETFRPKLELFPVAGGKTLYDWARSYLENGVRLSELMSVRSYEEAKQSDPVKSAAGFLRAEIVSQLVSLRSLLRQELEQNPSLPSNIDALLFSLFDELQQKRQAANAPTLPSFAALTPKKEES